MGVVVLSCTHRPASYTRRVALYLLRRLEARGVRAQFLDFQYLPREFLFSDLFGARSEEFLPFIEVLYEATKWLWVVPEYNGSYPGVVKVFIDALPREVFRGRWAGLVGLSDGRFGNLRGLEHLNGVLNYCGMQVLPYRAHLMHISERWQESEGRPISAYIQELDHLLDMLLLAPEPAKAN
ncbi:MAG: NAD(P)H-dependent oxidoreductase [Bacteroidia bacterium]